MRHILENDAPTARFADCYLLGNGTLGAAVRGGVGTKRLSLNLDTSWSACDQRRRHTPRRTTSLRGGERPLVAGR